ncbi:MAG: hypothetical protein WCS03_02865 [Bacteroidota bacterium]
MDNISIFESRPGKVTCSAKDLFKFVTDIRNFERFIQHGTFTNWQAEKESCSFRVSMVGNVSFGLTEKVKFSKVVFNGDALKKNDFSLILNISGNDNDPAEVKVSLNAELNPMLKLVAAKPIVRFLEILINEMENFRGWQETKE